MTSLLARFAENLFWLARYVERAEALARVLDVNESFSRDSQGVQDWLPVVQLYSDEDRFFEKYDKATAAAVIDFYVLDRENPASIASSIAAARENARSLRHLISTEMWQQLNVFHNGLKALNRRDVALSRLSRLCGWIKENCQAHTGIMEGTLYRDEGWCFYQIGKYLERADQSSRLLDIRYHRLRLADEQAADPGDRSQWNALLRSVAGYQAFRRVHPRDLKPEDVAAFLMFREDFPRSMVSCLQTVQEAFARLQEHHGIGASREINAALRRLDRKLHPGSRRARQDIRDLHGFVDDFQLELIGLGEEMGRVFFAHGT